MTANIQDAIVLLGDSLTQFGFASNGFAARLADVYNRKMDVVNRGFSGYNTDWIIPVFEQCFPTQHEQQHVPKARLLVIWFGANDAASNGQHVPLARFQANLAHLIRAVGSPESPYYSPDTRIVLVTPPPVDPERWARALAGYMGLAEAEKPDRSLEESRRYAEATKEVATREGVAVVDVWTGIWDAAGGNAGGHPSDCHLDGEHADEDRFGRFDEILADPENYQKLTKKRSAFPALN